MSHADILRIWAAAQVRVEPESISDQDVQKIVAERSPSVEDLQKAIERQAQINKKGEKEVHRNIKALNLIN